MKVLALMETLLMEKQDDKTEKLSYGPRKKSVVKKDEHWAMEVLESREDTEICTIVDLQNIKMFARTLSNPVYERVANFLIAVKRDPSIVYAAKTKKEAFDLIQKHTIQPIVWPEDW